MGVSQSTAAELRRHGHDVVHLSEAGLHRLPDPNILEMARRERRVLLTFDLDFSDLLATGLHELPSVIVFRLHDQTPASVDPRLLQLLIERESDLAEGVVVMVEEKRYRLRRLPIHRS
jgi:predicted nuclease of predicted toxin-antitoxin system